MYEATPDALKIYRFCGFIRDIAALLPQPATTNFISTVNGHPDEAAGECQIGYRGQHSSLPTTAGKPSARNVRLPSILPLLQVNAMCGRFNITDMPRLQGLLDQLGIDLKLREPRYNIAPTEDILLLREGRGDPAR